MSSTAVVLCLVCLSVSPVFSAVNVTSYFESPGKNLFQLNILPEYKLERYSFPATISSNISSNKISENEETILYRMPAGPKSPKAVGKKPAFIQHGILCDYDPCIVNKPYIAIAYILADRGFDVWLGISNSSMAENLTSNEEAERKRVDDVAKFILNVTNMDEVSIMAHFNNSVQFFGITAPVVERDNESKWTRWVDAIPGVRTAKEWYEKGRTYVTDSYTKIVRTFDYIGRKIDYVKDDIIAKDLKNIVFRAYGVMRYMVAPTFTIDDFSKMIDHPDVNLDTLQLLTKYGYNAESHHVETEDGYLLTLHRVIGKRTDPPTVVPLNKTVIFLQHGILASSADWVLMGPNKSLAYLLSDEGYDVWMGNSRGNTYSKGHVSMSVSDVKYWDFSWHEIGFYDLPASIDHVLAITGQDKLFYVGHSQGTTALFVLLSEKPEYNDKIVKGVLYAPIAYTENMRSPLIKVLTQVSSPLYYVLRAMRVYEFLPTNALLTKLGKDACEARSVYQVVCSNVLFLITGYDTAQLNKTLVPVIFGHVPAGSSVKQLFHYAQEYKSKKFQQFDYAIPFMNQKKYGRSVPPEYDISNIKIPVAIFYAANDLLADYRDIEKLASQLPHVELMYKVPYEHFNHIDFNFAIEAPKLIYEPTIKYIRNSAR